MCKLVLSVVLLVCCQCFSAVPVLDNLIVQLDGDHVVTDSNGFLVTWQDQSGSGNDAVLFDAVNPRAPYLRQSELAGHGVVDFARVINGNDDGYYNLMGIESNPGDFDVTTFTWFMIYKPFDTTTRTVLCTNYTDPSTARFWGTYHDTRMISNARTFLGQSVASIGNPGKGLNGWNLLSSVWDSSASSTEGQVHQYINGEKCSNFGTLSTLTSFSGDHIATVIGGAFSYDSGTDTYSFSGFYSGQIAELLIYNTALTEEEIDQVGSYLANKYGIVTPYPPTTCEGLWAWGMGDNRDADHDCDFDMDDLEILVSEWLVSY